MLKTVSLLNNFVETDIFFHIFYCSFDQFNVSLLNKTIIII